jgi:hypothetical protein
MAKRALVNIERGNVTRAAVSSTLGMSSRILPRWFQRLSSDGYDDNWHDWTTAEVSWLATKIKEGVSRDALK